MEKTNLKEKIEVACLKCKTKFDIWISNSYFSPEVEERIKKDFHQHCPVCECSGKAVKKA